MVDKRRMLKVKVKSLAAEAHIIRLEERKARRDPALYQELYLHRIHVVRRAARAALLAYGFLRGRALNRIEPQVRERYQPTAEFWKAVWKNVDTFGVFWNIGHETRPQFDAHAADQAQRFEAWKQHLPPVEIAA